METKNVKTEQIVSPLAYDISLIEEYSKSLMGCEIAHDFDHANRTRNWAVKIAVQECYEKVHLAEIAALLHDIGLSIRIDRTKHAEYGAKLASSFLYKNTDLPRDDIEEIAAAIRWHNNFSKVDHKSMLLKILLDADTLELLGATGVVRALVSHASKPIYQPENIKGTTWGIRAKEIDKIYAGKLNGSTTLVDQLNIHLSCVDLLNTHSAKEFSKPLVKFIENFILSLEKEVV